ncbi:Hint domain-containing protein [Rhodobacter sp. JA431]|uniref:Hint domain-containing protein n=1 Tax=Rhodobacter sp. JA431 TaxID=570013 RepID=UPI000BCDBB48|nr:Hint domain-containing protein [Rhodobacter sp. JA431]SOB98982.1 Hint domain-containing protein [Rhodobacter sp. JA431]
MTLTIYAIDNQFAAATGSNIGSGAGTSTFDYPPNSSKDLVISSQEGDPSPYIFSPGDTYTITFAGNGGDTIENATIIRSDFIDLNGDSGYAVVFEGLDSHGDLIQLVWTPDFDLETWYWDNFDSGNPPGFYTTDQSPTTYQMPCFDARTRVQTPEGERAIACLRPGDVVDTRDNGPQALRWIGRFDVAGVGRSMPVWFETGVLGNTRPLLLSRQHRVLLTDPQGEEVLVPAAALLNGATVRLQPLDRIAYVHLLFERHEIILAEGCACETLLLKRTTAGYLADQHIPGLPQAMGGLAQTPARPILTTRAGEQLWARIQKATGRKRAMFGKRGRSQAAIFTFVPCTTGAHANCRAVEAEDPAPV